MKVKFPPTVRLKQKNSDNNKVNPSIYDILEICTELIKRFIAGCSCREISIQSWIYSKCYFFNPLRVICPREWLKLAEIVIVGTQYAVFSRRLFDARARNVREHYSSYRLAAP